MYCKRNGKTGFEHRGRRFIMLNQSTLWVYLLRLFLFVAGIGLAFWIFPMLINKPFNEYHLPQIGLEWGSDKKEMIEHLNNLSNKNETGLTTNALIARLKTNLIADTRFFIPFYILLFFILALHIKEMDLANPNLFFYAIMICIFAAAIADWIENDLIWKSFSAESNEANLRGKVLACAFKWGLIGAAVALISLGYLSAKNYWVAIPGFVNAAILVFGTLINPYLIQWGFGMLGILLLLTSIFP